jgi:hypothetical protein
MYVVQQNVYKKREGGKKQKQKNYNNKRKFDRQHSEQPQKKKPLLETPMDEIAKITAFLLPPLHQ